MKNIELFKKIIKENNLKFPKYWLYLLWASLICGFIAIIFLFFAPVVTYSNGSTIVKPEQYSLFKLVSDLRPSEAGIVILLALIIFLGAASTIFNSFIILMFLNLLFGLTDLSKAKSKLLINEKLQLILSLIFSGLSFISIICLFVVKASVNNARMFSGNIYWTLSVGWGSYVVAIFHLLAIVLPAFILMMIYNLNSNLNNNNISQENLIAFFSNKSNNNLTKSNQEQSSSDVADKLKELKSLKEQGLITESDYEKKKNELLGL